MAVAAIDYFMGSTPAEHPAARPGCRDRTRGRWALGIGNYRLVHHRGVRRADARPAARAVAHPLRQPPARRGRRRRAWRAGWASTSNVVFAATFAVGSGLAGLGGALGAEVLGLDPDFPLKFMIYFLIVVDGRRHLRSITGPLSPRCCWASPTWPASTTVPELGGFVDLRRDDRRAGAAAARPVRAGTMRGASAAASLARRARWRVARDRLLAGRVRRVLRAGGKQLLLNEIAILALFALSLDLILGYAGIISLGHAAFFGTGAYAAGIFCKHGDARSDCRPARRHRRRRRARLRSPASWCCAAATSRA